MIWQFDPFTGHTLLREGPHSWPPSIGCYQEQNDPDTGEPAGWLPAHCRKISTTEEDAKRRVLLRAIKESEKRTKELRDTLAALTQPTP